MGFTSRCYLGLQLGIVILKTLQLKCHVVPSYLQFAEGSASNDDGDAAAADIQIKCKGGGGPLGWHLFSRPETRGACRVEARRRPRGGVHRSGLRQGFLLCGWVYACMRLPASFSNCPGRSIERGGSVKQIAKICHCSARPAAFPFIRLTLSPPPSPVRRARPPLRGYRVCLHPAYPLQNPSAGFAAELPPPSQPGGSGGWREREGRHRSTDLIGDSSLSPLERGRPKWAHAGAARRRRTVIKVTLKQLELAVQEGIR